VIVEQPGDAAFVKFLRTFYDDVPWVLTVELRKGGEPDVEATFPPGPTREADALAWFRTYDAEHYHTRYKSHRERERFNRGWFMPGWQQEGEAVARWDVELLGWLRRLEVPPVLVFRLGKGYEAFWRLTGVPFHEEPHHGELWHKYCERNRSLDSMPGEVSP
jgi:hypothetical protein